MLCNFSYDDAELISDAVKLYSYAASKFMCYEECVAMEKQVDYILNELEFEEE